MRKGWKISTLGELCKFENGDRGKNYPGRKAFVSSGIPFINAGHLGDGKIDWQGMDFIPQSRYDLLGKGKVQKLDLLFCLRGSLGKFGVVDRDIEGAIASSLVIVRPGEQIECDFLAAYFRSVLCAEMISKYANGAAQPNLSAKSLKEFQIPFPPISEQKRIIAILDEAFAGIDTAIANTEKNLANARELFGSYLNLVFSQRGEGWEERKLSDYARSISTGPFGSLLHKSDYVSTGVPLVNPINIQGDKIVPDENKLIDASTKQRLTSYVLQEGDVVIARRGEIGRCAAIDKEQAGWVCGTGCFFIRPKEQLNPKYLANLIRSSNYRQKLEKAATGATMKNITNKSLGNLVICVPLLDRQISILSDIDSLSMEILRLESTYQQKLNSLKELKQSLLQKAFSGELTAKPDKLMDENMA